MTLTKGDDFPIHQTPEPIAYSGTDRNFYDRYFFNGYAPAGADDQESFFAVAFGVYPHLNVADAAFCVIRNGVQSSIHASKWLRMERLDIKVGPISIDILEPLQRLKVTVDAPDKGIKAELTFTGRAFPIEEPRFIRRSGPRAFMDYTRLTQNGRWEGWIELDGERRSVDGFVGTRDRSWGIRGVGARDPQAVVPPQPGQFYWIWSPTNFSGGSFFFHTNDDAEGEAWNRRAVWSSDGVDAGGHSEFKESACHLDIEWASGSRHARRAVVTLDGKDGQRRVTFTPSFKFYMLGIGYGHPKFSHGTERGELAVDREDITLADIPAFSPGHLHIQALVDATYEGPGGRTDKGRGVLEQLVIGPHAPSGFTGMLDPAP